MQVAPLVRNGMERASNCSRGVAHITMHHAALFEDFDLFPVRRDGRLVIYMSYSLPTLPFCQFTQRRP